MLVIGFFVNLLDIRSVDNLTSSSYRRLSK
jgi:1,2-phenylacetyl-CoA epoxidase catalytic subunit